MHSRHMLTTVLGSAVLAATLGLPAMAESEAGDSASARQLEVMESAIHDSWLDGKLEASLLFNQYLNSFDIDTEVKDGVAYLSGAVESDIDKDLAGEIADSIEGITEVRNNLVVDKAAMAEADKDPAAEERRGFRQSVMDATLTARVKSELLLNSNTHGLEIDVDTDNGVVTLSGEVDTGEEKSLALEIARNADGTKSVVDRLEVEAS